MYILEVEKNGEIVKCVKKVSVDDGRVRIDFGKFDSTGEFQGSSVHCFKGTDVAWIFSTTGGLTFLLYDVEEEFEVELINYGNFEQIRRFRIGDVVSIVIKS